MKQGKLDNAKRRALNLFDEWNSVTGFVVENSSYCYELQSLIEDAVECGAQAASGVYEPLECENVVMEYPTKPSLTTAILSSLPGAVQGKLEGNPRWQERRK